MSWSDGLAFRQPRSISCQVTFCFWQRQDFPSLISNLLREMLKVVPILGHMSDGCQEDSREESLFQEHINA